MRTRAWVVVGLVVAVLLVADVAAASLTNRRAGQAFVATQHLPQRPYVHVDGWPFVTKGISGHYGHVTVRANRAVTKESDPLDLHVLKLELYDVRSQGGWRHAIAGRATGTAQIGFRSISKRLGFPVQFVGPGQVVATGKIEVRGRTLRPRVIARPELKDGDLAFTDITEEIPAAVDATTRAQLEAVFRRSISLDGLPFDLTPTKAGVSADAFLLRLSGRRLDLGE